MSPANILFHVLYSFACKAVLILSNYYDSTFFFYLIGVYHLKYSGKVCQAACVAPKWNFAQFHFFFELSHHMHLDSNLSAFYQQTYPDWSIGSPKFLIISCTFMSDPRHFVSCHICPGHSSFGRFSLALAHSTSPHHHITTEHCNSLNISPYPINLIAYCFTYVTRKSIISDHII